MRRAQAAELDAEALRAAHNLQQTRKLQHTGAREAAELQEAAEAETTSLTAALEDAHAAAAGLKEQNR